MSAVPGPDLTIPTIQEDESPAGEIIVLGYLPKAVSISTEQVSTGALVCSFWCSCTLEYFAPEEEYQVLFLCLAQSQEWLDETWSRGDGRQTLRWKVSTGRGAAWPESLPHLVAEQEVSVVVVDDLFRLVPDPGERRDERALRESLRRLREVVRGVPVAVFLLHSLDRDTAEALKREGLVEGVVDIREVWECVRIMREFTIPEELLDELESEVETWNEVPARRQGAGAGRRRR